MDEELGRSENDCSMISTTEIEIFLLQKLQAETFNVALALLREPEFRSAEPSAAGNIHAVAAEKN